jgi:hypothetical protein
MATIDEVQSLLSPLRISVTSETDDRFVIDVSGSNFHILKTEIDNYLNLKDKLISEPETSIYCPGYYYEHLIEYQAPIPATRRFNRNGDDVFQLSNQDNTLILEISPVSTLFLLQAINLIDSRIIRRRFFIPPSVRYEKSKTPEHWSKAFRRLTTIKISATDNSSRISKNKFFQIAESSLFHIAYGSGDGINLSRSWERTYYRMNQRRENDVQFPKRIYESDLVSYYQLALSSESLMLSYIALYKIIEYFFLSA